MADYRCECGELVRVAWLRRAKPGGGAERSAGARSPVGLSMSHIGPRVTRRIANGSELTGDEPMIGGLADG